MVASASGVKRNPPSLLATNPLSEVEEKKTGRGGAHSNEVHNIGIAVNGRATKAKRLKNPSHTLDSTG